MASNPTYYGNIEKGSHVGMVRSVSRSDNTTLEVEVVGKYDVIENAVLSMTIGDTIDSLIKDKKGDTFAHYRIKNISCSREAGNVGIARVSMVYAQSKDDPYHVTYVIDIVEVQKSLKSHPYLTSDHDAITQILMWEATPESMRYGSDNSPNNQSSIRNQSSSSNDIEYTYTDASTQEMLIPVTNSKAKEYCSAVMAGIETYNEYYPIVSKTSLYLRKPPGVSQNDKTHKLSGTLKYSEGIGTIDKSMDFNISGYTDGIWFKSKDSYSQNSDGTWQRTEEWTYSPDNKFSWIYDSST